MSVTTAAAPDSQHTRSAAVTRPRLTLISAAPVGGRSRWLLCGGCIPQPRRRSVMIGRMRRAGLVWLCPPCGRHVRDVWTAEGGDDVVWGWTDRPEDEIHPILDRNGRPVDPWLGRTLGVAA